MMSSVCTKMLYYAPPFVRVADLLLPSKALIGQGWFALDTFLETLVNMLLVGGLEHFFSI